MDDSQVSSSSQQKQQPQLILTLRDELYEPRNDEEGERKDGDEKICLVLASQSPRRREILDMMGLQGKYRTQPSPLDEKAFQQNLRDDHDKLENGKRVDPIEYNLILAEEKAEALANSFAEMITAKAQQQKNTRRNRSILFLGSDTIVSFEGKILEKPINQDDAKRMLQQLSGNQHQVHTSVAIYRLVSPSSKDDHDEQKALTIRPEKVVSFVDTATVQFATLHDDDIDAYIATGEPMDKAGSYGIQGMGGQFVKHVNGDFFTVMGLPMHETSRQLSLAIKGIQSLGKR